ncbi:hypothetical protein [Methylophaga sp.]|uniref:hypothetical protein n=1 Tax=Methylophaga sp. TaxID=2024840 RepID=UPI003A91FE67
MICYPSDAKETEISAIDDYWLESENSTTGFLYTLKDINERHKDKEIRPISVLVKESCFLPHHYQAAFTCEDCKRIKPATNRKNYTQRTKSRAAMICDECITSRRQRVRSEARRIIEKYKAEKFQSQPYIDDLEYEESLALLTLLSNHADEAYFMGVSPDDITITGVPTIDHQLLLALVDKNALVHIDTLPEEVERANAEIYGTNPLMTYHDRYKQPVTYRRPESITTGVYLNVPYSEQAFNISTITALLYQKVSSQIASIDDTAKIHQLVTEIQLHKLYQLVIHINQKTRLPIDNSAPLQSLLNHLAENYPPNNLFYTFRYKAKEAIEEIYTESVAPYIAKHYFAKFVGNYIQNIEDRGFELKRTLPLPPEIKTSSFEAIFSQIYLNGHFDWNRLSAKEVVALWLDNVRLSEDMRELTSDD